MLLAADDWEGTVVGGLTEFSWRFCCFLAGRILLECCGADVVLDRARGGRIGHRLPERGLPSRLLRHVRDKRGGIALEKDIFSATLGRVFVNSSGGLV